MNILNQSQYNHSIGKFKLLSSNAGVGSILTTTFGSYILVLDINKWNFIEKTNIKIENIKQRQNDYQNIYTETKYYLEENGLQLIDDERFVRFLKNEKKFEQLVCMIDIPHMSLDDNFNTPNWKNHPIHQVLRNNNSNGNASDYMVNAVHFPKWFKNKKGKLKTITEWKTNWNSKVKKEAGKITTINFAPPRDASDLSYKGVKSKNQDGAMVTVDIYKPLNQLNIVLICPNGHLSDIPWSKYINWKIKHRNEDKDAEKLFSYDDCCPSPDLFWSESTNKSEGYGSIHLQCNNCKKGVESDNKINLSGINSIKPICKGEKPWEQTLDDNEYIPKERCEKYKSIGKDEHMKVSLVTSNNIYYASGFSSIYIPISLAENKSKQLVSALKICNGKYSNTIGKSFEKPKNEWFANKVDHEFIASDCNIKEEELDCSIDDFIKILENEFCSSVIDENKDYIEDYRWQEYQCYSNNSSIKKSGLNFDDIDLPEQLSSFFTKIQQVDELIVTHVQLDFTRDKPRDRIVKDGKIIYSKDAKNIFSNNIDEQYVLPAVESLGEGLFFQFNEDKINQWAKDNEDTLSKRFEEILKEPDTDIQGAATKQELHNNGVKHFLVHSFAHMIMRELEFSCGYPTASLKERLYISRTEGKEMSGLLIYTAEGTEGSMGGLVSQGEPDRISKIISKGLERLDDCTSDPLCWESEGQGIFDLNMAACFSCSLVSETACEEMNLGLDRRVLVDTDFGFFKDSMDYLK